VHDRNSIFAKNNRNVAENVIFEQSTLRHDVPHFGGHAQLGLR